MRIARAEHVPYSKGNKAEKVCTRCKKSRSLDKFNVNKKTRILNKTCTVCSEKAKCLHKRERSKCKECGGGSICQHERQRSKCKECGGSQICQHQKLRSICKYCNPKGHLAQVFRSRVTKALRGDKELSSQDYLGCDIATFRAHLESQFKDGMSWDNYGDWNIGHWVPLQYKIDGKTPTLEEVTQRLHYINTQPLWRVKTARASKSGVH